MNKEKRIKRYEARVKKELKYKKQEWNKGRLILKSPLSSFYLDANFCIEFEKRLVNLIKKEKNEVLDNLNILSEHKNEVFIKHYRKYKHKSIYLILHYNPTLKKSTEYYYLKTALETYWDNPQNLIYVL